MHLTELIRRRHACEIFIQQDSGVVTITIKSGTYFIEEMLKYSDLSDYRVQSLLDEMTWKLAEKLATIDNANS